jgi:transglutaminase-like putative cysteine protease
MNARRIHSLAIALWLLLHVPWAPLSAAGLAAGVLALGVALVAAWTGWSPPRGLRLAALAAAPLFLLLPGTAPLQAVAAAALWTAAAALWQRPGPGATALCLFSAMVLLGAMALDYRLGTLAAVLDAAFLLYAAQGLLTPAPVGLGDVFSRAVLLAVPIAAVVVAGFAVFPSLSGRANLALPGLPAELQPGRFAGLIGGWSVAQVAFFPGPTPPPGPWYWRSRTLDKNEGLRWSGPGTAGGARFEGPPVWRYRLEPRRGRPAVPLDIPVSVPGDSLEAEGWFASSNGHPSDRPRDLAALLQRPSDGRGERTLALAAGRIFPAGADAREAFAALDRFFREGGFTYTRTPGRVRTLGEFLAVTKTGYCEHYAAAAANLLRFAGIPSRVVTGYAGGQWNPWLRTLTVRDADAHAWVEAWDEASDRWLRYDPTLGVEPSFGEQMAAAADPARWGWGRRVTAWMEVLAARAEETGQAAARNAFLAAAATAGTGAGLIALLRRSRRWAPGAVERWKLRLQREAAARGLARRPGETPLQWLRRIEDSGRCVAASARQAAGAYEETVYGGGSDAPLPAVIWLGR